MKKKTLRSKNLFLVYVAGVMGYLYFKIDEDVGFLANIRTLFRSISNAEEGGDLGRDQVFGKADDIDAIAGSFDGGLLWRQAQMKKGLVVDKAEFGCIGYGHRSKNRTGQYKFCKNFGVMGFRDKQIEIGHN